MKTTILLKENRFQFVLEPETEYDKQALKMMESLPNCYRAKFYDCQGGWTRQTDTPDDLIMVFDSKDKQK